MQDNGTATDEVGYYSDAAATFGDRLAGARESAGLTQEALANRLGVDVESLTRWEDDLSEPRANRLQMLAGMLNVSLSWLLTGNGDGPEAPEADTDPNPALAEMLTELRVLRTEMLQSAERLARLEKRLRRHIGEPA